MRMLVPTLTAGAPRFRCADCPPPRRRVVSASSRRGHRRRGYLEVSLNLAQCEQVADLLWTPGTPPNSSTVTATALWTALTRRPVDLSVAIRANGRLDAFGRFRRIFMLPNANNGPARPSQQLVDLLVACDVAVHLRNPVVDVASGLAVVGRTSMPKAPVDEDRHLGARKDDVRGPAHVS